MDILGEHVSKIGSLTVDAATDMQLDLLLTAFLQRCEPQPGTHDQTRAALRKLKLVDVSGSGYALTPNISRERLPFVFQTLRGLDDVTLEGTSLPWHSPAFEGLKRLHLVGLGTDALPFEDEFVNIIQNCPLLEKLKLEEAGLTLENSSDIVKMRRQTHPIDLHRLDSLHLSTLSWNEMEFILHLINAPNLKSLWIDTPTESVNPDGTIVDEGQEIEGLFRDEHVLKTVAVFINRSQADTFESSSLHTLHIESFDTTITADDDTNPHLMEVLKAVPNLNTLELCEIAVGDVVLESLSAVTPTPSVPGSPSKPPSKAPSMSTSISSIVSEQIPSPSIYPPPTSFAQYEFDEDDDDDEDWADEDTMEVDHDSSTPHQDHTPSPRPKKIIPICPSLQVLKLELIHDITREALRVGKSLGLNLLVP
ncbi:uncharacterized protein EI90DRAFT_2473239 [Cantharellus anzutake]|uniref:uncharacterized protein n=1 Tax=Cantharellus anzutake TaxID=1750568 RepID=UPI0019043893|nr:uncharacterized protein EI90DRAFT_2473239 [Cantharellus anzutake]KAF8322758.1 hypothetical protein EI90DRAFT_2473239 [Cantharellus anzutake]